MPSAGGASAAPQPEPGGEPPRPRVVMLAGPGDSTNIIFHALDRAFDDVVVVLENPVPRSIFVRNRVKRLGYRRVIGQLLFVVVALPVLDRLGKARVRMISEASGLDASPIDGSRLVRVSSVNTEECRAVLRRLEPLVVVVNGTRIIGEATLSCVPTPFLNMHAGITPRYRGVHGGYWALVEGRPDLVGTTVHMVDKGIDTGAILGQATFQPEAGDSFVTYPYLHVAAGLPLLIGAAGDVVAGREPPAVPSLADGQGSRLWSHPTLWGYLATRLRRLVA